MRLRDFCSLLNVPKQVEVVFEKKESLPSSFYTVINCAHPAAQKVARGPEMPLPTTLLFQPTKTISKEEKMPISRRMEMNAKWF